MGKGLDEEERMGEGEENHPRHPPQAGQGAGNLRSALCTEGIEVKSGRPCLRVGKLKGGNRMSGHAEEIEMPVGKHQDAMKAVGTFPLIASFTPGFCAS